MRKISLSFLLLCFAVITAAAQNTTPQIVARFQFTARTGKLNPVTIYTPTQSGMYRASCFMIVTVAGGTTGGYFEPEYGFSYNSNPAMVPGFIYVRRSTKAGAGNGSATFQADAGQAIQFSVTTFGDVSGAVRRLRCGGTTLTRDQGTDTGRLPVRNQFYMT